MGQAHLPGMEPVEAVTKKVKLDKGYICTRCHATDETVVWDELMRVFVCHACGYVDLARTKRAHGG